MVVEELVEKDRRAGQVGSMVAAEPIALVEGRIACGFVIVVVGRVGAAASAGVASPVGFHSAFDTLAFGIGLFVLAIGIGLRAIDLILIVTLEARLGLCLSRSFDFSLGS